MADQGTHSVSPEELAALDELARLIEQYQAYLIAGYPFADSTRAQASNASGTARPVLQRLHPQGAQGAARFESALRILRSEDDRRSILEDVESALKDLRALIATVRWRQPGSGAGVLASSVLPAVAGSGGSPDVSAAAGEAKPVGERATTRRGSTPLRGPRSWVWLWISLGLVIGLVLGLYRTAIPKSAGAVARLWTVFEPIVAAGSGAIVGELVLRHGFADAIRRRWGTLLICAALLTSSAPGALVAAGELLGIRSGRPVPAVEQGQAGPPAQTPPNAQGAASPSQPLTEPAVTETPAARGAVLPRATPVLPASVAGECARLLEQLSLGEALTQTERAFLKQRCRN